jgi:uncharacterized YigZ family protein
LHGHEAILFFETQKKPFTLQMPAFSYQTIQSPAEGTYKEKGSKFLAFAYPVESEADIKDKLALLRKKYFDARHHCYAWMIGAEKKNFRANDDGEPGHSAGDPILGQIRSKDLTNVLVVVVRYFGGVKLGVGGLIAAYRTAAEDALVNATIVTCQVTKRVTVDYDYAATPEVMRMVKDFDLTILDQNFNEGCRMITQYKLSDEDRLLEKINLMSAMGIAIKITEDFS